MNNARFWNEIAKQGAVLGSLLALSAIFELWGLLSGKLGLTMLMSVEWIAVAVIHYILLHRFTKQYSRQFPAEEGFTFWQGYSYQMLISLFAGILVGVVQAVALHQVIGYTNYIDRVMQSTQSILASSGALNATTETLLSQTFSQLESAQAPSVLATAWGGVVNELLFAAFFGLIIAGVLSRAPKLFGGEQEEI